MTSILFSWRGEFPSVLEIYPPGVPFPQTTRDTYEHDKAPERSLKFLCALEDQGSSPCPALGPSRALCDPKVYRSPASLVLPGSLWLTVSVQERCCFLPINKNN